jgi:thiamine phosphate synthase YjbQ (UPF0047 family)
MNREEWAKAAIKITPLVEELRRMVVELGVGNCFVSLNHEYACLTYHDHEQDLFYDFIKYRDTALYKIQEASNSYGEIEAANNDVKKEIERLKNDVEYWKRRYEIIDGVTPRK